MTEPPAETLLEEFDQSKEQAEIVQVLKELFDRDKIPLISDLSADEVSLITRLGSLAQLKGLDMYAIVLKNFMELQLSNKRKSRTELIDAVKGWAQRFRGWGRSFTQPPMGQPPY